MPEPPRSSYLIGKSDTAPHSGPAVVAGAFRYTGRFASRPLKDGEVSVRTLTGNRLDRSGSFGGLVVAAPLDFSDPDGLFRSCREPSLLCREPGSSTATYWLENSKRCSAAVRASAGQSTSLWLTLQPSPGPLLPGQGAGGGGSSGYGYPSRHHQAHPGLRRGRPTAQQHGLGAARFPIFPVFASGN